MLLDWQKTENLLRKYRIPLVENKIIESAEQGIVFSRTIGYPVVLKLLVPENLHKIDKGLVKLNIQNEQQLSDVFMEFVKEFRFFPEGRSETPSSFDGEIVIQKQVSGAELFLGMKRDKTFGPVLSFGLGGIFVEVLNDVVLGVCPVNKRDGLAMIKKIKGYKILRGYRGQKPVDINKLADILANVSRLAMENENIKEIDFNPLFAAGGSVAVADAKIII